MADYFAALAARTLRPELSVQPRQHVRWEEAAEPIESAFGDLFRDENARHGAHAYRPPTARPKQVDDTSSKAHRVPSVLMCEATG